MLFRSVIEYNIDSLAELLRSLDFTHLFSNSRFHLLVDISEAELKQHILELYKPVLYGGIRVIPLRSRVSTEAQFFSQAGNAIQWTIDKISGDYSVQAHFGKRWFSNIIRNIKNLDAIQNPLTSAERVAVTAAGPSLLLQVKDLCEKRKDLFLIATDTSLPCLLHEGIIPDAVVSIDCQHISYYHFMEGLPEKVPLFLDLASPPLLASLAKKRRFFSCGHPLTSYVSQSWESITELDSSGGNVTYAAISLAEQMGASEIELYGADYSYPMGVSYARGTYIYPFFEKKANRFSPLEAQASAFLFRTPLIKKSTNNFWYYETTTMSFYREKLEEKSYSLNAAIFAVKGMGAPIHVKAIEKWEAKQKPMANKSPSAAGTAACSSDNPLINPKQFLSEYSKNIKNLPSAGNYAADYLTLLSGKEMTVFTTLLPAAAAIKRQHPDYNFRKLLKKTIDFCVTKIDKALAQ